MFNFIKGFRRSVRSPARERAPASGSRRGAQPSRAPDAPPAAGDAMDPQAPESPGRAPTFASHGEVADSFEEGRARAHPPLRLAAPNSPRATPTRGDDRRRPPWTTAEIYDSSLPASHAQEEEISARPINPLSGDISAPSRFLPGPEKKSRLTAAQQKLIGVARWPDPKYNSEKSAKNKAYGLEFFNSTRNAGKLIAEGKIDRFDALWQHAAEWRFRMADPGRKDQFRPCPPRTESQRTDLVNGYDYLRRRLLASDSGVDEEVIMRYNQPGITIRRLQQSGQLGGEQIPLTVIKVFDKTKNPSLHPNLPVLRHHGIADCIDHTEPEHLPKILRHIEALFAKATADKQSPQAKLHALAEMHWWMANAMPDPRGSAAKAEFCVRSLAYANGIELPPFKHGIVPDLEAIDPRMSCADFVTSYESMLDGPVVMPRPSNSAPGVTSR